MNKILSSLLIAAAVSSLVVFAEGPLRATSDNSKHWAGFALHGKTSCVLVDDKVFCAPAHTRAPDKLASAVSN